MTNKTVNKLRPLTFSDADFREYLETHCESKEQIEYLRSAKVEDMRVGFLQSTFDDLEFEQGDPA